MFSVSSVIKQHNVCLKKHEHLTRQNNVGHSFVASLQNPFKLLFLAGSIYDNNYLISPSPFLLFLHSFLHLPIPSYTFSSLPTPAQSLINLPTPPYSFLHLSHPFLHLLGPSYTQQSLPTLVTLPTHPFLLLPNPFLNLPILS